jgi:Nif-specific regulatory protein
MQDDAAEGYTLGDMLKERGGSKKNSKRTMLERIDPKKLDTLIEINTLINSNYADATSLLTHIIESATRLTEGEASSLILKNPEDGKLYFEIALGSKGREMKKFSLKPGEGIAGWVAAHSQSLIVNDVETDSRFYGESLRA